MCGFAGFSNPKEDARSVLAAMLGSITYRGPDQAGCYFDHSLALGHLRLTIINPEGGEQPRVDRDSGDALAFNGEIYGYRRHAAELQKQGLPLRDQSDTEVLFCMLRHYGIEETLKKIDGMFAFAFRDGKTGAVYLARDKFGEKPLYYSFNNGCFVFASEVKSIKTHPACRQAPFDPEAISQYLTYEFVPEQKSFYSGISKLLPAHYLKFYKNNLEITSYWQQSFKGNKDAPAHVLSEEACINQLDSLLTSSVRDRLIADVPIGVFLSGGVDSSLISALAVRCAPDITAFSIQMPELSYDESHYARRVAEYIGIHHEVMPITGDDILRGLDEALSFLDEPFADSSLIPTYLLCRAARQRVTVALGGDGADELFAGYPNFIARKASNIMARVPTAMANGIRNILSRLPVSPDYMSWGFLLKQLTNGLGEPNDKQSYLWMAAFTDKEKKLVIHSDGPLGADDDSATTFSPIEAWLRRNDIMDPTNRMLYLFGTLYLPDNILTKIDRASMYNSLEVRSPFLGNDIAEFAMSLSPSLKIKGLTKKYILKKLAARYLPEQIVNRPKHGFALPMANLIRGPLRSTIVETILDSANSLANWFSAQGLEKLLTEHMNGQRDHRKKIWTLYVLFRVSQNHVLGINDENSKRLFHQFHAA